MLLCARVTPWTAVAVHCNAGGGGHVRSCSRYEPSMRLISGILNTGLQWEEEEPWALGADQIISFVVSGRVALEPLPLQA